jgi:hypothetical protein
MFPQDNGRVSVREREWAQLDCKAIVEAVEQPAEDLHYWMARIVYCTAAFKAMSLESSSLGDAFYKIQCQFAINSLETNSQNVTQPLKLWIQGLKEAIPHQSVVQLEAALLTRLDKVSSKTETDVFNQVLQFCNENSELLIARQDGLSFRMRELAEVTRRGEKSLESFDIRANLKSDDVMARRTAFASAIRRHPLPVVAAGGFATTKKVKGQHGSLLGRVTRTPIKSGRILYEKAVGSAKPDDLDKLVTFLLDPSETASTAIACCQGLARLIPKMVSADANALKAPATRTRFVTAAVSLIQEAPLLDGYGQEHANAIARLSFLGFVLLAFDLCDPRDGDTAAITLANCVRAWIICETNLRSYDAIRSRLEQLALGDDELFARESESGALRMDALVRAITELLPTRKPAMAESEQGGSAERRCDGRAIRKVKDVGEALRSLGIPSVSTCSSNGDSQSLSAAEEEVEDHPPSITQASLPAPPLSAKEMAIAKRRDEWKSQHVNCTALYDYADPDGDELYLTVSKGEILWIPTQSQTGAALSKGKDWVLVERYCDDPNNPPVGVDGKPFRMRGYVPFSYVGFPGYE